MNAIIKPIEWHQARAAGIGGSDIGAIAGVNKYRTPLDVYLEKTGQREPVDLSDNLPVLIGTFSEPLLRDLYQARTGRKVRQVKRHLKHKDFPWMVANLDGKIEGERRVWEAKTGILTDEWGASGTDIVPASYLLQVTHYMIVTGYVVADLVVLLAGPSGFDVRVYHFDLDPELAETVIEIEREFWLERVGKGIEPAPINTDDLLHLFPRAIGEVVEANAEIAANVDELRGLKEALKEGEARKDELEFSIKNHIGEAARLEYAGDKLASWSRFDMTRVDSTRLKEELPEVFAQYSKTSLSNRLNLTKQKVA